MSASQVSRITGMSHRCPARTVLSINGIGKIGYPYAKEKR
jgi:hypothetical protein